MTDTAGAALQQVLLDRRPTTPPFDGPQVATVNKVGGATCMVTLDGFDSIVEFGPAPLPVGATVSVGSRCLVVFVDNEPYVQAVYS